MQPWKIRFFLQFWVQHPWLKIEKNSWSPHSPFFYLPFAEYLFPLELGSSRMGPLTPQDFLEKPRLNSPISFKNNSVLILIKQSKIKYKEKILKAVREKLQITYNGIPIRLTADLSAKTLQGRREWQDIFKVMKGKNLQQRWLYLARISFRFDGEIKTFTGKQKLREFSTTKPALQQMLKALL